MSTETTLRDEGEKKLAEELLKELTEELRQVIEETRETDRYVDYMSQRTGFIHWLGTGQRVEPCIGETLCVSGALADRAEVFVRVVGPKPNGKLWPTLVKFSTSRVEVWIEQIAGSELQYYDLAPVNPGEQFLVLEGLADKLGFDP